jgi:hypothetical protein
VGSVPTFVNGIGFAISIAGIALFSRLVPKWPLAMLPPWLALGLRAPAPLSRRAGG